MDNWWQEKFNEDNNFLKTFNKWEFTRKEYKVKLYILLINSNCKSILNLGCGTGQDYIFIKKQLKKNNIKFLGIDNSKFMVDSREKDFPIKYGDIRKLDFDDNSYDSIIIIDVLEHIDDIKPVIEESIRVSKNIIIISFFKIPIEENTKKIINVHKKEKDEKVEKTLNKGDLFLKENPAYRKGFCKDCFYNYHNKNYIENILSKSDKIDNYIWNIIDSDNGYLLIKMK